MVERTTVRLPEDLLQRARRKAAAEGRTLTSLIEDGLRLVTTEPKKAEQMPRVLPRVSTATGGMHPGFENMSFSELQELDDIEYIKRLNKGLK